mgnify:CR=1 FL=1
MKANRGLLTPSDPPVRPSYWLFSVATTSLHISCINITSCTIWLEKNKIFNAHYSHTKKI